MSNVATLLNFYVQRSNVAGFLCSTTRRCWVFMFNVATLLDFYVQHCDVGHECLDVAGFSNDWKLVKIRTFGLLISSKYYMKNNTGSTLFKPKISFLNLLKSWVPKTENSQQRTDFEAHKCALIPLKDFMDDITCQKQRKTKKSQQKPILGASNPVLYQREGCDITLCWFQKLIY